MDGISDELEARICQGFSLLSQAAGPWAAVTKLVSNSARSQAQRGQCRIAAGAAAIMVAWNPR